MWKYRSVTGWACVLLSGCIVGSVQARTDRIILDVPDYGWWAGCFGTANGNLMGFWDRNGFPDFYTGPTNGGVAPMNSRETQGNDGIRAMWSTQAGLDGRPEDMPGHFDDYYDQSGNGREDTGEYESVNVDPYIFFGREEHEPDCIGDFIGLSQDKWSDLNGECVGNINAYSFVFWDQDGDRRTNFDPGQWVGEVSPDIPTGLRAWTRWRGYEADSFSQLTDFNPHVEPGKGFAFEDLRAEIDAGYPVLLFMQSFNANSRTKNGRQNVNPGIHGMLAFGYTIEDDGRQFVRYRTSWGSGDQQLSEWSSAGWIPFTLNLPVRGVMGYHPKPQVRSYSVGEDTVSMSWHGPMATVRNNVTGVASPVHRYIVEKAERLDAAEWQQLGDVVDGMSAEVPRGDSRSAFFRVRLLSE